VSPTTAPPAVRARGLVKRFGQLTAVDGVDVTIARRECFGFLGPNGAGKTTTMRMVCCLARRDAGELEVLGMDPDTSPREVKRRLGVVAQETNLDVELTVRENLLVYARYFDIPRADAERRAGDLLRFVGLEDRSDDAVDRLSGGMRRRLQIARALVNEPDVVVLDEPTTGLDPQARHLVWDRLRALRDRGVTLILTTHYMDEAEELCDRLVVMDGGRVVREGRPSELIAREVGREVLQLEASAQEADAVLRLCADRARGHRRSGPALHLFTDSAQELYDHLRGAGAPAHLRLIRRATLEDVFLAVTGHLLIASEADDAAPAHPHARRGARSG
jgi:lipooligosaccharide transport system ATP-binding protein